MRRNVLVAATVTALATAVGIPTAGASPGAPAAPEAASAGDCPFTSSIKLTPGLTMTPQDFSFELAGAFPCAGGEVATIAARGTGNGSCLGTRTTVPFTVTWSDGTTSKGTSEAVTSGPVAAMSGRLAAGRFAGSAVTASLLLVPSDPFQCGLNGVTAAVAYGQVAFTPGG
jgi:hypothetical protein